MAGFIPDKDRKIIPRWRTFYSTLRLRELDSIVLPRAQLQVTSDFLATKIMDWSKSQTVGHAADLVGSGLTLGREREVAETASFLLQDELNVSPWARELAMQALRTPNNTEIVPTPEALEKSTLHKQVRTLRHLLRTEPRDPITWVELSLAYAILGLREQAERSMIVALQLAMNNRFVLRSASRLWVHLDDPQRAHDILVKVNRTRHDPWLLAAEIAIGSIDEKTPRFVKAAQRMLNEGSFSPIHISELASAVATLELSSGSVKKSRKLFVRSLEHPTENSIAQAAWASRQKNSPIRLDNEYLTRPDTFEARYWSFYFQSRWEEAIKQCWLWQFDQPFSSRPSVLGSYVSAIALEDYETSKRFAECGLLANPADFMLLNNLAFARINLGDMEGAKKALSRVGRLQLSVQDGTVLQATQGLWEFRTGNVARGRQLYLDARSEARKMQDQASRERLALATAFHAMEEVSQDFLDCGPVSSEAFQMLKRVSDPIFRVLEQRLIEMTSSFRGRR